MGPHQLGRVCKSASHNLCTFEFAQSSSKVVNTVTHIVDRLPPDVFEEAAPPSPPSAFSPHDSFDSMGPDIPAIPTPANGPDAERNNIIRELVETERKYVQDLEVMQVRTGSFL